MMKIMEKLKLSLKPQKNYGMYFSNPEKSWNFKILTLHFKRVYYNLLTSSIVLLIHGYIISVSQ